MRNLIFILFICSFPIIGFSQIESMQGTVRSESGYKIAIYGTPSIAISASNPGNSITINFTVSIAVDGYITPPIPVTQSNITGVNNPVPAGVGLWPAIENGRYVYSYIMNGSISPFTWGASVEMPIAKIDFTASANLTDNFPRLQHDPNGGLSGASVFYVEVNSADWTNYTDLFYGGTEGTIGSYEYVQAATPLPINLVAFEAKKYLEKNSFLQWTTSSEINSDHFSVQRSTDQVNWITIGKVKAAGNSQIIQNYEYIDENVYNGKSPRLSVYYRLDMIDQDGQSKMSSMKNVVFGNTGFGREISVYPNPSSEGLQIEWQADRFDQPTQIEFFDVKGKLVYSSNVPYNSNQQYIDYDQTSILPGLYILRILSGTEAIEHKQIIVTQR